KPIRAALEVDTGTTFNTSVEPPGIGDPKPLHQPIQKLLEGSLAPPEGGAGTRKPLEGNLAPPEGIGELRFLQRRVHRAQRLRNQLISAAGAGGALTGWLLARHHPILRIGVITSPAGAGFVQKLAH